MRITTLLHRSSWLCVAMLATVHCGGHGSTTDGGGNDAMSGGDVSTADVHNPTGTWTMVTNPAASSGATVHSIWGSSSMDVWAVGGQQLLHNTGTWSATMSQYSLQSVTGTSATNAWIAAITIPPAGSGQMGMQVFEQWTGGTITDSPPGTTTNVVSAIFAISANDIWGVGAGGYVLHYDGQNWNPAMAGLDGTDLFGVWGRQVPGVDGGPPTDDVVAVGAKVWRWDGSMWHQQTAGGTMSEYYYGVWGFGANDIWISGQYAFVQHWNGTAWQAVDVSSSSDLYSVWGAAANDVWMVGGDGAIVHWNGQALSMATSPTTRGLHAVWGSGASDIWAGGEGATLLHYQ
jgi:hypothetical protein